MALPPPVSDLPGKDLGNHTPAHTTRRKTDQNENKSY
jgi:hypothetical protein